MKTLTIRNVPDEVHAELAAWATESRRSLQEQVLYLIEEDVKLRAGTVMESVADYRARLAMRELGNVVQDVRGDRDR
jgi:plasmid stability protein